VVEGDSRLARHVDIERDEVRAHVTCQGQSVVAVVSSHDGITRSNENRRQQRGNIRLIVHNQHPLRWETLLDHARLLITEHLGTAISPPELDGRDHSEQPIDCRAHRAWEQFVGTHALSPRDVRCCGSRNYSRHQHHSCSAVQPVLHAVENDTWGLNHTNPKRQREGELHPLADVSGCGHSRPCTL